MLLGLTSANMSLLAGTLAKLILQANSSNSLQVTNKNISEEQRDEIHCGIFCMTRLLLLCAEMNLSRSTTKVNS